MAAVISAHIGYLLLTFIPPVVWLLFYLREDRHPEPKLLILLAFAGGMGAAVAAVVAECMFVQVITGSNCRAGIMNGVHPLLLFGGIALIEEYFKYAAIKFLILRRPAFDEPIDAMIYLMTSAMGFAALENALFLIPIFRESTFAGLEIAANRFLGANLLHALSSGIVGFFLARAWWHRERHHMVLLGVLIASVLHTLFNYLIMQQGVISQGTFFLFMLLAVMTIVVLIDFQHLKRERQEDAPVPTG